MKTRGIEFGDFVIEFTDTKIFVSSKRNPDTHFIVNLKTESGVIDVHRTTVNPDGTKSYETLFLMKQEHVLPLLTELSEPMNSEDLLIPVRRLRFGWLRRRFMYLLDGQIPDEAGIDELSKRNKRRRREFDLSRYAHRLRPIVDYEDCVMSASSVFGVCFVSKQLRAKQVGFAFKVVHPVTNRTSVFWIKAKHLHGHVERIIKVVEATAKKYEVPKAEYHRYSFARD